MANRRKIKKNGSKSNKNLIYNEVRNFDTQNVLGNTGKEDHCSFPKESSDIVIKNVESPKENMEMSNSRAKLVQVVGKGFFGNCEAIIVNRNKSSNLENKINASNRENFEEMEYSSYDKKFILCSSVTKGNRKSRSLSKNILKQCGQNAIMDIISIFNKINYEMLNYCFFQNFPVLKFNLNETLIRSKLKTSPLSDIIFDIIIKEDEFTLFNIENCLAYNITPKNSSPRNVSQENIYFTLNCVNCKTSSFICQSLDDLFSFKDSRHKKRCDIYINQQNYLSLIYDGCFFPILKVRNCHKCSSIKLDNISKINFLKHKLTRKEENLGSTISVSPEKTFLQTNLSPSAIDFIPKTSNLSASCQDINIVYSSNLCNINSDYNCEEYQFCGSPYMNNETCSNCMSYIDYPFFNLPFVSNCQNMIEGCNNCKMHPTEEMMESNNVEMVSKLLNSNSNYNTCFQDREEGYSFVNDGWINENESSYCHSNCKDCINNSYSSHVQNSLKESNECSSTDFNSYSNILNKTAENDIISKFLNQGLNELSNKNYKNCLNHSDYIANNHISHFGESTWVSNNILATTCPNFSTPNQMFICRVNQNLDLDCSNCLTDQHYSNTGYIPSNVYVPVAHPGARETSVPEMETKDNVKGNCFSGENEDFVEGRKSLAHNQCFSPDTNEESQIKNCNISMSEKQHDNYSNKLKISGDNKILSEIFSESQAGIPKYVESQLPSSTETRENFSEYELPNSEFCTSDFQTCNYNRIYNPTCFSNSGNKIYNSHENNPRENKSANYSTQIPPSYFNNTVNLPINHKPKYRSRSLYKPTSDNYHNYTLSSFPNEHKFTPRQYTKHRGYFNNGTYNNKNYYIKPNYKSFNSTTRFGETSKYYLDRNQKSRNFIQNFGSPRKLYGNTYRKREFNLHNYPNQLSFSSKFNMPKHNYRKGSFTKIGNEYTSECGEIFNSPQEDFFNAAANPNSYTY